LLAAVQRLDDATEHRVDDHLGVLLGEIRHARDFLDQLRLGHAAVGHTVILSGLGARGWLSSPARPPQLAPSSQPPECLPISEVIAESRRAVAPRSLTVPP